jgi:hypothetical protein
VRGLWERLQEPMNKLLSMDRSVLDLPAFRTAHEKFDSVMAEMQKYEARLVEDWCRQVRAMPNTLQQHTSNFFELTWTRRAGPAVSPSVCTAVLSVLSITCVCCLSGWSCNLACPGQSCNMQSLTCHQSTHSEILNLLFALSVVVSGGGVY